MFYVYLIKDEAGGLYYGFTGDLRRRLAEHNSGSSKFTSGRKWKLVYYEAYFSSSDARQRESSLKKHGQALARLKLRLKKSLIES